MDKQAEFTIYFLVRRDLKMGKGKIAAQCGHAVQELILNCPKELLTLYRKSNVYSKICLQIQDEVQMNLLEQMCRETKIPHHRVIDAGRTQIEPNTPTVLGIGPVSRDKVRKIVGDLKLL